MPEIVLPLALAFIMFSLGLGLTANDLLAVVQRPKAVMVGIICQLVLLPLLALLVITIVPLSPTLAFGVMLLAFCPGGVTSNIMTKFARGTVALSIALTGIVSLISIATLPLLVTWSGRAIFGEDLGVDITGLGLAMVGMTLVPVSIGMVARRYAPATSQRAEPLVSGVATGLFVLIVIASVVLNWELIAREYVSLGPLLIGFNVTLFAIGLLVARLAAMPPQDRTAIAIETGIQNSAMGVTIGTLIVGGSEGGIPAIALPAGLYGITFYLVGAPFILWSRRQHAGAVPSAPQPAYAAAYKGQDRKKDADARYQGDQGRPDKL